MFVFAAAIVAASAANGAAQVHRWEGHVVHRLVFDGLRRAEANVVKARMATRVGEPFRPDLLSADLRTLAGPRGMFETIDVDGRVEPEGLALVFRVSEKPFVGRVEISGVRREDPSVVEGVLGIRVNDFLGDAALVRRGHRLERWYHARGYAHVEVVVRRHGSRLHVIVEEGPETKVEKVLFRGNREIPGRRLERAVASAVGSPYVAERAEADAARVSDAYRRLGFFDAAVELIDVLWSSDFARATLVFAVDEGPRYVVSGVEIEGNRYCTDPELRGLLRHPLGAGFDGDVIMMDGARLLAYYRGQGYVDVTLDPPGQPGLVYHPSEPSVTLVYRLAEGRRFRLGRIRLEGNRVTQDRVLLRSIDLRPGKYVDHEEVERAVRRLERTGHFESVAIDWRPSTREDVKDLVVSVRERPTGEITLRGAVDLDGGASAILRLVKTNFDLGDWPSFSGGGQTLALEVAPGTRHSEFRLAFREPAVFGGPFSFAIAGSRRSARFDTYRTERTGMQITVGRELAGALGLDDSLTVGLTAGLESNDFENRDGVDDVTVPVSALREDDVIRTRQLGSTVSYLRGGDGRDGRMGVRLRGDFRYASGSTAFLRTKISGDFAFPLAGSAESGFHALGFRGSFGWSDAIGRPGFVPLPERFFIGGSRTLRGLDFQEVGPRDRSGDVTGGEVMWASSLEYRFPVFRRTFGGLVFVDAGALADQFSDRDFRETRITAGLGFRFRLGGVPVSVDFGVPVLRERDDENRVVSFTVGRVRF